MPIRGSLFFAGDDASGGAVKADPAEWGMNIEWTDLSFQQATQGNTALIVFPVAVLLAFLVLAALYGKLDPAAGSDPYRADDDALRAVWCLADRGR